ncbi:MAG: hypothetical protein IV100_09900 [Myxococcales bacterium]|nr:hypothetical protein [Myxococcales bacterium]
MPALPDPLPADVAARHDHDGGKVSHDLPGADEGDDGVLALLLLSLSSLKRRDWNSSPDRRDVTMGLDSPLFSYLMG